MGTAYSTKEEYIVDWDEAVKSTMEGRHYLEVIDNLTGYKSKFRFTMIMVKGSPQPIIAGELGKSKLIYYRSSKDDLKGSWMIYNEKISPSFYSEYEENRFYNWISSLN